ncbi:vacuolar protein sorting 54 [Holotrichia oblita]|uniref:Vacuolar protein sorting 54 n=3 Tax=Holotrichia oblita TaxID=644536 RepID=A0ACB9T1Q3_HOLOL|nr:vacuolar protein sorting 54 [Holotrichia oblita]KAI4460674.1 vacuolar protein sorting 54 [Holotrichia oblita]KAI4460688.1 vacuolar protein sorting 54 [Holotrichia oblita]
MSETAAAEQWSLYSAAQNLPAVLNDPNRGKQSNFFVKTWGDTFIEKVEIEKSPFLPDITYSHFESYLKKVGRRIRRHRKLSHTKFEGNHIKTRSKNEIVVDASIGTIPAIYLKPTLPLNEPAVFNEVFPNISNSNNNKNHQSGRLLQEELSHYLDIVEVHIAKQVSQKSGAFFHAMTSHDTIMEKMGSACNEVRALRTKIEDVDKMLAKDSLKLLALGRSRSNQFKLLDKLKLMSVVLQTQPTLQLLLSSSDFVAALELISSTQEVLAKKLAGVTSLRHLPSQLKEMSRLIDKMLSTEFERYAAADLHRPFDPDSGVLEREKLVSLVAGLLRQQHLQFLETYKQEAVTAAQTLLKQLLIEQLADVEDDMEHCLTGSGEAPPSLDSSHWLQVLSLASEALGKLVQRVKAVHDVIKHTAEMSAGFPVHNDYRPNTDKFLSLEEFGRVEVKLRDLLASVCDYCHERLASLVSTQSDKQSITANQIMELSDIVENFTDLCEKICGRQSPALKAAFKIQAGNYVHKFHSSRKHKLTLLLDAERWKTAEVPAEFQLLVDKIASGEPLKSIPSSPVEDNNKKLLNRVANSLKIGNQEYVTVGTVLILIRLVSEYCVCAYDLPILAVVVGRNLAELLRTFNSRSCQLVLGAGALRTAGLKTITSTNLALTSRALQLVLWLIPHVRAHFSSISNDMISSLDAVERDIGNHIQQLENKILSIMNILLGDQLNEWDAKPPVPSKAFRNVSRHLTKLYEAVGPVLPEEQVGDLYEVVHDNFKIRLREQLAKMNIRNNGGPQHGVVTSELTFYLETMKGLKVLPDSFTTSKAMEDIWNR